MMLFRLALSVFSPLFRPSVVRSFVCLFVSLFELLALRGGSMPFLFLHPITTFSVSLLCARLHQTLASNQRPIAPVTLLALLFQFSFPRSDGSLCTRCASQKSLRVPLRCWNEGNNTLSHPRRADVRRRHVFPPWSNASCRYQFFALLRFALFSLLFAEKVEATVRLTRRGLLFVFLCGRTCVACVVYVSYFSDRTPLPSTPAAARRPSQC